MNICVFASSSDALAKEYKDDAIKLSQLIAQHSCTLVNGGANVGLMEQMIIEAKKHGAKSIGVLPEKLNGAGLASTHLTKLIVSSDMADRKAILREQSDAFIALAGGFGTLEEILEVITLKQLEYHNKPIVFVNTNNFYRDLLKQFERSYTENFAKETYRGLYYVAKDAQDAMDYILNYKEEQRDSKWYEVPK